MSSLEILRCDLDEIEEVINRIGWDKATSLMKYYRRTLIQAINFIQVKNYNQN